MRLLARRLAEARTRIAGQAARIRELEKLLAAEQDRARALAAERPEQATLADLRRRLRLAERARASLDAQILTLQAANEATARTDYDRRWAA
ncbi:MULTISPECIES: hypothetical protein [Streptomyces]|uniref:Uncharacterized protein n=1 Tax=Streptomyces fradiae ATCC 10745 = DSM 40063 TaxID=1319510 RepID=A0A1Y2NSV1_STRFR|nr:MULTISPECIES: hypothetical protein [Streptomyces]KAF0651340.1 hypothetical protein K701_04210 [Streptomyces fradiae ATCC 10745 = DSM 40063]OSY50410.1 hypothetical protein BG846_03986 [Streptomyces fradiae ATCC 10745 = DSM 40063]QEV11667.1 hypothetical protein CP974_06160 [Streptomyces fradiae ATCC 10745 = DSM 40063]